MKVNAEFCFQLCVAAVTVSIVEEVLAPSVCVCVCARAFVYFTAQRGALCLGAKKRKVLLNIFSPLFLHLKTSGVINSPCRWLSFQLRVVMCPGK